MGFGIGAITGWIARGFCKEPDIKTIAKFKNGKLVDSDYKDGYELTIATVDGKSATLGCDDINNFNNFVSWFDNLDGCSDEVYNFLEIQREGSGYNRISFARRHITWYSIYPGKVKIIK